MSSRVDMWIGSAQVLIDKHGHTRAVLVYERKGVYRLIGPVGTVKPILDRSGTEAKLKRLIEKELRDAGYYA